MLLFKQLIFSFLFSTLSSRSTSLDSNDKSQIQPIDFIFILKRIHLPNQSSSAIEISRNGVSEYHLIIVSMNALREGFGQQLYSGNIGEVQDYNDTGKEILNSST
jgi:hypothetical protein